MFLDYILYLFGMLNTDAIVADFNKTQRRLERHAARHDRKAARHTAHIERHRAKARYAEQEMARADHVARKIADLVA